MGLFGMALEGELDALAAPVADPAKCQKIMNGMMAGNMAAGIGERPNNLTQAVGNTAKTVMQIAATGAQLRQAGCPDAKGGPFEPVSDAMRLGSEGDGTPRNRSRDVSFEPGKPMIDVSRP